MLRAIESQPRLTAENTVAKTMEVILSACKASMPHARPQHAKPPVYWWSTEIAALRVRCLALRRRAQRATNTAEANTRSAEHKEVKKLLRKTINSSKARCWKKLVNDIDRDPWGLGYKIVTKKLGARKPPTVLDAVSMQEIVRALFPSHLPREEPELAQVGEVPLFTDTELGMAIASLKNFKAPGPDGIPSEILKMVYQQTPEPLLNMYNQCLLEGVFSLRWKTAKLVLVSKEKGDPGHPSSYRPLCMLDTAGKVMEKLVRARLNTAIRAAGDLSPKQFGFRMGLSTTDAIHKVTEVARRAEDHNHFSRRIVLLVTLDVRNAFNSARWCDMLGALEHSFQVPAYLLRIVSSYLMDRAVIYDTEEGPKRISVTSGVAQGSILGPDLWNASYDSLLRLEVPDETELVGYADDIALLVAARDIKQAQQKLNQTMRMIGTWMTAHGLNLALNKTEIVILTKKRIPTSIPMWVGSEVIETREAVRYLGVMMDSKLNFFEHIRQSADKAAKGVMALGRLMANVGGPKASKRRLLMSATQSVLLYGAEVWGDSTRKEMYRKRLSQVQRRGALRVASAYRTVSEAAVLVIAGVIPIHLLARERKNIYARKAELGKDVAHREERARTMECWQAAWEEDSCGRWTWKLVSRVGPWIERDHGEVSFYLTQFLSGHGYFRSYLHRMGKVSSQECLYCPGIPDDAEHTFFSCGRWDRNRRSLEGEIGTWSPMVVQDVLLRGEDNWNRVTQYVEKILKAKKVDLDRSAVPG